MAREIHIKIVYYPLGEETNQTLLYIYERTDPDAKSGMISLATGHDPTMWFDFSPLNLGTFRGFSFRFHLYTVPWQVFYDASRRLILKGVDGIVFMPRPSAIDNVLERFDDLRRSLSEQGYRIETLPLVVQYREPSDDASAASANEVEREITRSLGGRQVPVFAVDPWTGVGVFDGLKAVAKQVLDEVKNSPDLASAPPAAIVAPMPSTSTVPERSEPQTPAALDATPLRVTQSRERRGGTLISYRHGEAANAWAGRIYDFLAPKLDRNEVFMDVDSIRPGVDFLNEITRQIEASYAVLVVIGSSWMTAAYEDGRRRLEDPRDVLRGEVRLALNCPDCVVIPVLLDDVLMPRPDDLPEDLRPLTRLNYIKLRHGSFRHDAKKLLRRLRDIRARRPDR